jgi:hypothetical protein
MVLKLSPTTFGRGQTTLALFIKDKQEIADLGIAGAFDA